MLDIQLLTIHKNPRNLYLWGDNTYGQLGDNKTKPLYFHWSAIAVTSSSSHSVAIRKDGTLWAWGLGTSGQLGNGDLVTRSSPVQITQAQTDLSWQLAAVGDKFTIGTRADGTLWSWGDNSSGQLGTGDTVTRSSPAAVRVNGINSWNILDSGISYAVALKTDGTLWSWGDNSSGQLGQNDTNSRSAPVQIAGSWSKVSCGDNHVLAIKSDGSIWGWGQNIHYELGLGDAVNRSSPVLITSGTWSSVSAGSSASMAIDTAQHMWAVGGNNSSGLLGLNNTADVSLITQVGTKTWLNISVGNNSTIGVDTNSFIYVWGDSTNGQLGLGDTITRSSPVQLSLGGRKAKQALMGNQYTAIIDSNDNLLMFGNNNNGQLGDNS